MITDPLAGYEDWPRFLQEAEPAPAGDELQRRLVTALGARAASASGVEVEHEWTSGGVRGRRLRWRLPFGPPTVAYLLTPERAGDAPLPGLLALHCHGGVRSTGAEQLVRTDLPPHESAERLRTAVYDGRSPANDLARAGFAVLCHDTFSWGSRAFDLSAPTPRLSGLIAAQNALWREQGVVPSEAERFDAAASLHEDTIAKAAGMLGTTLAGAVVTDDLAALDVLASQPEVDSGRIGVFGLSGGGGRAALVGALDGRVRAVVITCMMATYGSIVPNYLDTHSWLLNSPGLWQVCDWPEVPAIGRARATLVQYGVRDPLFARTGMDDAHQKLLRHHGDGSYRGSFHDAGHLSTAAMQAEAAEFLADALRTSPVG
ncbi:acetylxylan esterase [Microbacterium sp. NEAU-LLC]|uniref:Acetylxylan esterase n=1 Tax=Microbacterium helvum TaxID=2773713 RepID=A0ABR8NM32_9MICO|nr:dienelactone hydrolase family protein [Microbacterium helvum]MBD3940581.1 acetylxylan esterase [Microbacterium helvum]